MKWFRRLLLRSLLYYHEFPVCKIYFAFLNAYFVCLLSILTLISIIAAKQGAFLLFHICFGFRFKELLIMVDTCQAATLFSQVEICFIHSWICLLVLERHSILGDFPSLCLSLALPPFCA